MLGRPKEAPMPMKPKPGEALPQEGQRLKELTAALDQLQTFTLNQLTSSRISRAGSPAPLPTRMAASPAPPWSAQASSASWPMLRLARFPVSSER